MSGEVHLTAPADSVIARSVRALARFPADEPWVLIGGIAVFLRLGSVTRPTADADTVARSQALLLDRLVAEDPTILVANGDVTVPVDGVRVEVDVMDLADDPLPLDAERQAFALARRLALHTATGEAVSVIDAAGIVVAEAVLPIASVPALVALKTVSMVRRPNSHHPEKVGSDIHDLVRLVDAVGARVVGASITGSSPELARWMAERIEPAFGTDLRYTLLRLRRNDRSAAARALTDETVAAVGILADVPPRSDRRSTQVRPRHRHQHGVLTASTVRGGPHARAVEPWSNSTTRHGCTAVDPSTGS